MAALVTTASKKVGIICVAIVNGAEKIDIKETVVIRVIPTQIIGKTNPKEASTGTIRGDFGIGILENSIHASDSKESFDKEVNIIF